MDLAQWSAQGEWSFTGVVSGSRWTGRPAWLFGAGQFRQKGCPSQEG